MIIAIGSDHRGFLLKHDVIGFLRKKGNTIVDKGTHNEDSADYPIFGFRVANMVKQKKAKYGILICYSGQGMAMSVNRVNGIRAAIAWNKQVAQLARAHNNANIIVLPAGFIKKPNQWKDIILTFLQTKFEGGRHQRRLEIISKYENKR